MQTAKKVIEVTTIILNTGLVILIAYTVADIYLF